MEDSLEKSGRLGRQELGHVVQEAMRVARAQLEEEARAGRERLVESLAEQLPAEDRLGTRKPVRRGQGRAVVCVLGALLALAAAAALSRRRTGLGGAGEDWSPEEHELP